MKPFNFGFLVFMMFVALALGAGWEGDMRQGTNLALLGAVVVPLVTILYAVLQIMWRARKNSGLEKP